MSCRIKKIVIYFGLIKLFLKYSCLVVIRYVCMKKYLLALVFLFINLSSYSLDYYWVGGCGDWSDINHWAVTSGGSLKHLQVPTASDNVFFDKNSFDTPGDSINLNTNAIVCHDLIVNKADSFRFVGVCKQLNIYGSFKLQEKMEWPMGMVVNFRSMHSGNHVVTSKHLIHAANFEGNGGEWILDSALFASTINHTGGTLNSNGCLVDAYQLSSYTTNPRELKFGSSKIKLKYFFIEGGGISTSPGTSEIIIKGGNNPGLVQINSAPPLQFYDLTFKSDSGALTSNSNSYQFHNIKFMGNGYLLGAYSMHDLILQAGKKLFIEVGFTQTINGNLYTNSECYEKTSIIGNNGIALINKTSGIVDTYYTYIKNISASGGAVFNAYNSYDLGGNSGWNFTTAAPRTLYWVDGTGDWGDTTNWSLSSGGPSGECPPSSVDNVIIDQNSGNCDTINLNVNSNDCHDITWIKNNSCPVTMKGGPLNVYGSMNFDNYVDYIVTLTRFCSSDLGETVKTGNILFKNNVFFNGFGGWTLMDSLKVKESVRFVRGHLNTNDQYVSLSYFVSDMLKERTLTLGSSIIDVWKSDTSWVMALDSMAITPGTSHIRLHDSLAVMKNFGQPAITNYYHNVSFLHPHGQTRLESDVNGYNKVEYKGNALIKGYGIFDSLLFAPDRIYELRRGEEQQINNYFRAHGGCLGWITIMSDDIDEQASILSSSADISVDRVVMRQVKGIGSANFLATNSSDQGENTGWTFTTPTGVDHYWVGGSGNWGDTTHWSYTSGGPGGACLPTPFDDVYFDANSFQNIYDSVNLDVFNAHCHDMDWTGATNQPVLKSKKDKPLRIYGSLNLLDTLQMSIIMEGNLYFSGRDTGNTIHSGGQLLPNEVYFDGLGGKWSLLDTLNCAFDCYLDAGYLKLNSFGVNTLRFLSEHKRGKTLDLRNSRLKVYDYYLMITDSLDVLEQNSLVELEYVMAYFINKGSKEVHYDNVLFSSDTIVTDIYYGFVQSYAKDVYMNKLTFINHGYMDGHSICDTLVFSGEKIYKLACDSVQTVVDKLILNTNCNEYTEIRSYPYKPNHQAYLMKINGDVNASYVKLANIGGIGMVNFNAYESYDQGGNSGWVFHPKTPLQLYWVNGEGDWNDPNHWSYTSGGPGGACIPREIDDVYFDVNSFPNITGPWQDTVFDKTAKKLYCHDMDWTGAAGNPVFTSGELEVWGSLKFIDNMKTSNNQIFFKSDSLGETIDSRGKTLGRVRFLRGGGWTLNSKLYARDSLVLSNGHLNSNGQDVKADVVRIYSDSVNSLTLDTSDIYVRKSWIANGKNLTLDAGQSFIHLEDTMPFGPGKVELRNGNSNYYNFSVYHPNYVTEFEQKNGSGFFNKLILGSDIRMLGSSKSDTLICMPGYTYAFDHTTTQRVYDHWQVRGNNCFSINLESTLKGHQAKVKKDGTSVQGDFLNMRDMKAIGNSTFYAGAFSADIGNNDNWIFANGPNYVYGLPDTTYFNVGGTATLSTVNFNGTSETEYIWSTGSTADSILVDSSAWYVVTVTYAGGCVVEDSTYLGCILDVDYTSQMTSCFNSSDGWAKVLTPDSSYSYTFLWETGSTSDSIYNQPGGWHKVVVTANQNCSTMDSALIEQPPPVIVPLSDTVFCEGDSLMLDAGAQFIDYSWHNGSNQRFLKVWQPDTFIVKVKDIDGCWSDPDTVAVSQDARPAIFAGRDTTLCLYDQMYLKVLGDTCAAYLWSNGSTMQKTSISKTGKYWVNGMRGACVVSDTVVIHPCDPEFIIPNVFTPNGDGYNDRFKAVVTNIKDYEMIIFNRWGKEVYRSEDMFEGWDGNINNSKAAQGVYFFVIYYTEYVDDDHQYKKDITGSVTLLR